MTSGRDLIHEWLFEYACRHSMPSVLQEILANHSDIWSDDIWIIPPVFPMMTMIKNIMEKENEENYSTVIDIVNDIYERAASFIPYKIFSKLTVALKILVLFQMLKRSDRMVLPRLNSYFPRTGFHNTNAEKKTEAQLNSAQFEFRTFFLKLIANESAKNSYFAKYYEKEYGAEFVSRTKDLMNGFIQSINDALPQPTLDQLIIAKSDSAIIQELNEASCPAVELLLNVIHDKDHLTEVQVLDILRSLHRDYSTTSIDLPSGLGLEILNMRSPTSPRCDSTISPPPPPPPPHPRLSRIEESCDGETDRIGTKSKKRSRDDDEDDEEMTNRKQIKKKTKIRKTENEFNLETSRNGGAGAAAAAGPSGNEDRLSSDDDVIIVTDDVIRVLPRPPIRTFTFRKTNSQTRQKLCVEKGHIDPTLDRKKIVGSGASTAEEKEQDRRGTRTEFRPEKKKQEQELGSRGGNEEENEDDSDSEGDSFHTCMQNGRPHEKEVVVVVGDVRSVALEPVTKGTHSVTMETRSAAAQLLTTMSLTARIVSKEMQSVAKERSLECDTDHVTRGGLVAMEILPSNESRECLRNASKDSFCSDDEILSEVEDEDEKGSIVADSDSENLEPSIVVPSSYSFDKFDMVCGETRPTSSLPSIEKHKKTSSTQRLCLIKLHVDDNLDVELPDGRKVKIFN